MASVSIALFSSTGECIIRCFTIGILVNNKLNSYIRHEADTGYACVFPIRTYYYKN